MRRIFFHIETKLAGRLLQFDIWSKNLGSVPTNESLALHSIYYECAPLGTVPIRNNAIFEDLMQMLCRTRFLK